MKPGELYVGTSGWVYSDWQGIFYPEDLPSKNKLKYFSNYFKTTEINYSFYHLPRPSSYQNWYNQTPEDFIFAVKASRFITHTCLAGRQVKRLQEVKEAWKQFLENAFYLKEKLGPILFQFPPSFRIDLKRLESFLKILSKNYRYAFEFRHKSWCGPKGKLSTSCGVNKKVYNLLKKYNVAWVIADSPSYPKAEAITADFIYIRMHGSQVLFASKYTKNELSSLAQKIKKYLKQGLDVYVYFNNDFHGYAIENAKELSKLCK